MVARIYRPARSAMQSGKAKSREWLLSFEPEKPGGIEPLMGYTGSVDMRSQITLSFPTLEDAEAYARRAGLAYRVEQPHEPTPKRLTYSDNFKFDRKAPWTH